MSARPSPELAARLSIKRASTRYAFGVATVLLAFALRKLLEPATGTGAPFVLFFAAVLTTSLLAGLGPGLLATLLSVPLAAYEFAVRAGFGLSQAASQAALFAADCAAVIALSRLTTRARRASELAEERLRLATEATSITCWDLDVASGQLRWAPEGGPDRLQAWLGLVHPDDRELLERSYARSLEPEGGGELRAEFRVAGPEGATRWLSWVGRTYFEERDGRLTPIRQLGTAIDVTGRRLREEALRQLSQDVSGSEARLRSLIALAPDAFLLMDPQGRISDANAAASQLLGYSRDELLAKRLADLLPPEDRERLPLVNAYLCEPGRVYRAEWSLQRRDGSLLPVELSASLLPDGHWQALARDISLRKRIEDKLQVFVSLLANSSDFIGIADPEGKPIYVNPAGRRMVGLSADYPVEQTRIPEYYPPEERGFASEVILRGMLERGHWAGETHLRHWQTGAAIPVSDEHFLIRDASGSRLLGMGTIIRDISETRRVAREREQLLTRERVARQQAEAANEKLRISEERFRLTIDEAPIGMALVGLDGRFLRVNRSLCEIVGYSAPELERLRFQDITHPEDLDSDLALVGRLARGEIPRYQLEKRYLRKDGSIATIMLSASTLRGRDGAPICFIAQIEDLTERKRAEAADHGAAGHP